MERYIQQLIEDLEQAAQKQLKTAYFEADELFSENLGRANLAMHPSKTIEELSGINQEVFPEASRLSGDQYERVNKALFQVFESLDIGLLDLPDFITPEKLYNALSCNWQHPVHYKTVMGRNIELCTDDPVTCPYGEYCDCGSNWDDEVDIGIPEILEPLLPKIAQVIEDGFICFVDPDTGEIEEVENAAWLNYIPNGDDVQSGRFKHLTWDNYIKIDPIDQLGLFQMMNSFKDTFQNEELKAKLEKVFESNKPLTNFNETIVKLEIKQDWLDFKDSKIDEYIRRLIWEEINEFDYPFSEMSGFYNDDGTPLDPKTVPIPSLCLRCREYYLGDAEENVLCILNRNDQHNQPIFKCGAFKEL